MKKLTWFSLILIASAALVFAQTRSSNETVIAQQTYEYATVRFMAGNRTCITWPDRSVEFIVKKGEKRPDDTDERMYWLCVAMNVLAKRGFEPIQSPMQPTPDDIVARRAIK